MNEYEIYWGSIEGEVQHELYDDVKDIDLCFEEIEKPYISFNVIPTESTIEMYSEMSDKFFTFKIIHNPSDDSITIRAKYKFRGREGERNIRKTLKTFPAYHAIILNGGHNLRETNYDKLPIHNSVKPYFREMVETIIGAIDRAIVRVSTEDQEMAELEEAISMGLCE